MYHEEKMVDGVWCVQSMPDGPWIPYGLERLSMKYVERLKEIGAMRAQIRGLEALSKRLVSDVVEDGIPRPPRR